MSFKEIKELRIAGKLEEALALALKEYEQIQEPIILSEERIINFDEAVLMWPRRALAWVYYDYLKKHAQPDDFDEFKINLVRLKDLQLPEDEKMVFDNCAWQIGSLVFGILKTEPVDYVKINELFEIIKEFHFTKPSEAYSFIYKAFHKAYLIWSRYLDFADWWSFENFRPEDYLNEEFNGRKMMSIAEQAYIAYSKKLLEDKPIDAFGQQSPIDKERIQAFLPKLDALIEKHPEYQYPPYFKAKLLLALGKDENLLETFLPFAKQKRNNFWVWELLAEIFQSDSEIQFACYCKALSLKTPEEFLVKLRQTFAQMLIVRQMYDEAKTEIQRIINTRENHEWKIPAVVNSWTGKEWYKTAIAKSQNDELYKQHIKRADEILFQDIPQETIVIEFVNTSKKMASFVKNKEKAGFFKYDQHFQKIQIGDIVEVRLELVNENFYRLLTARHVEHEQECEAIEPFDGVLLIKPGNSFGFVDNIFVEPRLINNYNLGNGQQIKGKAILSFNKKKNEWGWKAFHLTDL